MFLTPRDISKIPGVSGVTGQNLSEAKSQSICRHPRYRATPRDISEIPGVSGVTGQNLSEAKSQSIGRHPRYRATPRDISKIPGVSGVTGRNLSEAKSQSIRRHPGRVWARYPAISRKYLGCPAPPAETCQKPKARVSADIALTLVRIFECLGCKCGIGPIPPGCLRILWLLASDKFWPVALDTPGIFEISRGVRNIPASGVSGTYHTQKKVRNTIITWLACYPIGGALRGSAPLKPQGGFAPFNPPFSNCKVCT